MAGQTKGIEMMYNQDDLDYDSDLFMEQQLEEQWYNRKTDDEIEKELFDREEAQAINKASTILYNSF